jgi:4-amino-4-deoxy-L-arabinose transferase-like glycosyltransferase
MSRLRRIFAVMALALIVAPLAANAPLFDPDEGLHASIAQEMAGRGDYVTPTFLGEPFLDKPILFFWAEALSIRTLGSHEAAVRLPPLVFGLLGMIGVAMLGRTMFDETAGLIAGVVYGTMLLPLGVSEVAVHDVAVVPFMCAACAALARVARDEHAPAARTMALAGIALGLSILTKGLVAIAFTGILGVCLAVNNRSTIRRLTVFLAAAGGLAILVALPWYLAMERAHSGYVHYYFVERHLRGYLTATQRHAGRGWWYYVPIVIGGSLPWTGYLVAAARTARTNRMQIVVWAWCLAGLIFLSAGESKLVTYVLPLFPGLAILIGKRITAVGGFGGRLGFGIFAASLALMPPGALLLVTLKFGGVDGRYWLIVVLVSVAIVFVALRARPDLAPTLEDGAAAALRLPAMAIFGLMIVTPLAARWMTARDLAAALNREEALPPRVSVLDERIGSLIFYLSPPLRAGATSTTVGEATLAETIARIHVEPVDAVIAVRDDQLARFSRLFPAPPVAAAHAGTFQLFRVGTLQAALRH